MYFNGTDIMSMIYNSIEYTLSEFTDVNGTILDSVNSYKIHNIKIKCSFVTVMISKNILISCADGHEKILPTKKNLSYKDRINFNIIIDDDIAEKLAYITLLDSGKINIWIGCDTLYIEGIGYKRTVSELRRIRETKSKHIIQIPIQIWNCSKMVQ